MVNSFHPSQPTARCWWRCCVAGWWRGGRARGGRRRHNSALSEMSPQYVDSTLLVSATHTNIPDNALNSSPPRMYIYIVDKTRSSNTTSVLLQFRSCPVQLSLSLCKSGPTDNFRIICCFLPEWSDRTKPGRRADRGLLVGRSSACGRWWVAVLPAVGGGLAAVVTASCSGSRHSRRSVCLALVCLNRLHSL